MLRSCVIGVLHMAKYSFFWLDNESSAVYKTDAFLFYFLFFKLITFKNCVYVCVFM